VTDRFGEIERFLLQMNITGSGRELPTNFGTKLPVGAATGSV